MITLVGAGHFHERWWESNWSLVVQPQKVLVSTDDKKTKFDSEIFSKIKLGSS